MNKKEKEQITFKVTRYDPLKDTVAHLKEYTIPYREHMPILDALLYVYEEIDHTLAARFSCEVGSCQVCQLRVNGKTAFACQEEAKEGMVVEPLPHYFHVKDLVVDFNRKMPKVKETLPLED